MFLIHSTDYLYLMNENLMINQNSFQAFVIHYFILVVLFLFRKKETSPGSFKILENRIESFEKHVQHNV